MNRKINLSSPQALPLDETDVFTAMQELGAYLDITLGDFKEIYTHAYTIARRRLLHDLTARDIMSSPVLSVPCHLSLREAVAFLDEHSISGAPVLDEHGELVGVLSESDIARAVGDTRHNGVHTPMSLLQALLREQCQFGGLDASVESLMSSVVIAVAPSSSLSEQLALLRTHNINRLPVVEEGKLVGLVSRTDILNAFGAML